MTWVITSMKNKATIMKDVAPTLTAEMERVQNIPMIFDARGNGEGGVSPTITGGHQSSISDYTAIVLVRKNDD